LEEKFQMSALSLDLEFDCETHKKWKSIGKMALEHNSLSDISYIIRRFKPLLNCGERGPRCYDDTRRLIELYKYHYSIEDFEWNPELILRVEEAEVLNVQHIFQQWLFLISFDTHS
jgi:hypothetical protein